MQPASLSMGDRAQMEAGTLPWWASVPDARERPSRTWPWTRATRRRKRKTRSDAAIEVPDDLRRDFRPGIQERHLPGGAYAVVHHCGPASVRETYEACFRDWSPRFGWKPDARPMIVELSRGGDWADTSLYVAVTR